MELPSGKIALEDVYDLASEIGGEFEKIIDQCGSDAVSKLMPKVIRILEHLEMLTLHKDDADNEVDKLKLYIHQLESDKREKAEKQLKYEFEMEQIEENWRMDNMRLAEMIERLKGENIKLSSSLTDQQDSQLLFELQSQCQLEQDSELKCLKASIERSNKKIESHSKEMENKNEEIQKLYDQLEMMMQQNRDLRRRVKHLQLQSRQLADEKTDLQVRVQDQGKELIVLQEKSNKICCENSEPVQIESPNKKPKFTLNELRSIIMERNDLKARVSELEDELSYIKSLSGNQTNNHPQLKSKLSFKQDESNESEVLPVQGPINQEPEDKLFPEKHTTKILGFFPIVKWNRLGKNSLKKF